MMTHRTTRPLAALLPAALLPAFLLGQLACTAKTPRPQPDEAPVIESIDPLDYAPVDAELILSASPRAFDGSWLDRWFSQPELQQLREYTRECELAPERLERFVMFTAGEERGIIALVGPGVGERKRLRCLERAYQEHEGAPRVEVHEKHSGELRIEIPDYGAGYVINESALLLTTEAWRETARELARGVCQRAKDGPIAPLLAELDTTRELSFVGLVTNGGDSEFPVESFTGVGTISSGLELDVVTAHKTAEHAEKAGSTLRTIVGALPIFLTQDSDTVDRRRSLSEQLKDAVTVTQKSTKTHISLRVEAAPMELIASRLSAVTEELRRPTSAEAIDASNGPM